MIENVEEGEVEVHQELEFVEDAKKITINYKGGEKFRLKNVFCISLGLDKGGKMILKYSQDLSAVADTEYGQITIEGLITHTVLTGDIESIELDLGREDGIRRIVKLEV